MMRRKFLIGIALSTSLLASAQTDYSKGVFIVNEDWYGHQNSTLTFLDPDASDEDCWHYRAFREENEGNELGATNQFGAIYDGKFYLIAKQDKDPGSSVQGGRITVTDAKTLKLLYQSPVIDPSGTQCDGRGFVGVTPDKGYISSSNGVWVMDLNTYAILGQIPGTENPFFTSPADVTDPMGALYYGQTGTMVAVNNRVFVAHQQYGCQVIDAQADTIISTINPADFVTDAGIGSIVQAKDGDLYLSLTSTANDQGEILPYLLKLDSQTLETQLIIIPEPVIGPSSSWYAWTPDSFCASRKKNALYWSCSAGRWFASQSVYRYDIDRSEFNQVIDLSKEEDSWNIYGCSLRVHPETDEIYVSLYHEPADMTYLTRRYTADGEKIRDYSMIRNYWFPSLFVFPETPEVGITDLPLAHNNVQVADNQLICTDLANTPITITSMRGEVYYRLTPDNNHFFYPMALPRGIYIISYLDKVKKVKIN